jgi:GT2 family glycosyltransferase
MKLSVIIVNYNVKYFLEVCLHSVSKAIRGMDAEMIVVDNNSQDDSCAMVRDKFPDVVLIENRDNKGFSKANNQGVAVSKGEYIHFLNPDTVMPEDFLSALTKYMDEHPEAGSIGPRLIDGKGEFSPDGKKSFPSLSVAIFKTTGINKIFKNSPYFNKYYAVHVGENELAEVDVLSGCCMMVRRTAMEKAGGAFDEDFFMYCEDVDLSYRIVKAGYKNIYHPATTLIHYKGESTKKATISYVRIFNEALATFVKKHYSRNSASLFVLFINIGIMLRAVMSLVKSTLKVLRMPLFDAIILLMTLWLVKEFWVGQVKNIMPIPLRSVYLTFPVYILIWIASLFLNGAYDQPYRGLRVVRGLVIGTVICVAYYGLLPPELRYSRAVIFIAGITGGILLIALHELLYRLGIFKYTPYDALPRKAVIVGDPEAYASTASLLQKVHYAPDITGRIATDTQAKDDALTDLRGMKPLLYTAGIQEVIFCVNSLSYDEILKQMQDCGNAYDYKIHLKGSPSFVGSNSAHTAGDLYTMDRSFNLSGFAQLRNKRVVDLTASALFLLLFPVTIFLVKNAGGFISNCFKVLAGACTWVGYDYMLDYMPPIRPGILPPYNLLEGFNPNEEVKRHLNLSYAQHYNASADLNLILKNFRFLGRKNEKDFVGK